MSSYGDDILGCDDDPGYKLDDSNIGLYYIIFAANSLLLIFAARNIYVVRVTRNMNLFTCNILILLAIICNLHN